jgi:hypothetical protein
LGILVELRKTSLQFRKLLPAFSLCLLLGAVSFTAIHTLDLERLAISPIPGEHTPVPTHAGYGTLFFLTTRQYGTIDSHVEESPTWRDKALAWSFATNARYGGMSGKNLRASVVN